MTASRNDASVHTLARVPSSVDPRYRGYAFTLCVYGVRAPVAAPCVLPAAVEGDCE
jgi:hypothetical protein